MYCRIRSSCQFHVGYCVITKVLFKGLAFHFDVNVKEKWTLILEMTAIIRYEYADWSFFRLIFKKNVLVF